MLRFIAVNAKGGQATGTPLAKWLRSQKPLAQPLVAAVSEIDGPNNAQQRIVNALNTNLPGVRIFHGTGDHGSREVAVVVLGAGVTYLAHGTYQLTPGSGWAGATQDRWVTVVTFKYLRRKYAVLSTHAPTGTWAHGTWASNLQANRWQKGMLDLGSRLTDLRAQGFTILLGGDFNQQDSHSTVGLRAWGTAHGLNAYVTGVGWALTDKRLTVKGTKVLPLTPNISDHPTAIRVDIKTPLLAKPVPAPAAPAGPVKVAAPNPPYLGPAAHTSSGSNMPIHRIVIHCTVSPCVKGGARATAAYFRTQASGGSAQYVVDPGEVVQSVYDGTIAWHAPPNSNSIGIELTDSLTSPTWDAANANRWTDANHVAMLGHAAELTARLCLAYGVPLHRIGTTELLAGTHGICGHVDVSQAWHQSTHWDPGAHFPWDTFMRLVNEQAAKIRVSG